MILSNIDMSYFLLKWPSFCRRIASFLKMNGVRLESSRAVGGSIMLFTALNHTLCSSGDLSTTSSSRRTKLSKMCLPSDAQYTNRVSSDYCSKYIDYRNVYEFISLVNMFHNPGNLPGFFCW